jgi:hypothetical protein
VVAGSDQRSGRRISTESAGFKSPCGTAEQVSQKGGECLRPIFDLIEGNFQGANSDQDVQSHCNRFNVTSRCVRQLAKDCLNGIHKTSVSAVSTAMRRFYTNECKSVESRALYLEPLKCAMTNGPAMKKLYQQYTGVLQGARDLSIPAEEKVVKMCCVLNEIDAGIEKIFNKNCGPHTATIIKLVHAITDDARNTLCLSAKCKGALDKLKNHKYTPPQNFIEPVQQILFQL